jgi:LysR family glycine cleavage system transcriptional activator
MPDGSIGTLAAGRQAFGPPVPEGRARLPALDALRVFEAAARHASFTKAANEMCVTQAAVSHRIQALEVELGVVLFRRLTRRLELTAEGERLALGVRDALERIARTVGELDRRADSGPLKVSMLPSFASRWMIPRLPRFQAEHPEILVQINAEDHSVDLWAGHGADLAIRYGRGHYPGLSTIPLMPDSIAPVCSPAFLAVHGPVASVDDLLDLPLLHDTDAEQDDSGSGWRSWLTHVGAPSDDPRLAGGPRLSHAHFVIEAALLGQGVAMARTSLVAEDLAAGRLVRPLPQIAATVYRYYLVCRFDVAEQRKVACLRDWLLAEAQRAQPSAIVVTLDGERIARPERVSTRPGIACGDLAFVDEIALADCAAD